MSTQINIDPVPPRKTILSNKFTPLVLLILDLALFFYIIPEPVAAEYDIFFALVGGVITLILSFWTALALLPKLYDKIPIVMGLLCISSLFIFGYFFILKSVGFSSGELKENGVKTEAVIVDMTQIYGKRGNTIQSMDVTFLTDDNQRAQATIDLSEREYDNFERGMSVQIIYSSKHPEIARIAR